MVDALSRADIAAAHLPEKEQRLLEYVAKLTRHSYRVTAEDAQSLRDAGWSDAQIAEAVFVSGLFALFNRVADAFGLMDPGFREMAARGEQPPVPAQHSS